MLRTSLLVPEQVQGKESSQHERQKSVTLVRQYGNALLIRGVQRTINPQWVNTEANVGGRGGLYKLLKGRCFLEVLS